MSTDYLRDIENTNAALTDALARIRQLPNLTPILLDEERPTLYLVVELEDGGHVKPCTICPSRELAQQIVDRANAWHRATLPNFNAYEVRPLSVAMSLDPVVPRTRYTVIVNTAGTELRRYEELITPWDPPPPPARPNSGKLWSNQSTYQEYWGMSNFSYEAAAKFADDKRLRDQ